MLNYIKVIGIMMLFTIAYSCYKVKEICVKHVYPMLLKQHNAILQGSGVAFLAAFISMMPNVWLYYALSILVLIYAIIFCKGLLNINGAFLITYILTAVFCGMVNLIVNKIALAAILFVHIVSLLILFGIKEIRSLE